MDFGPVKLETIKVKQPDDSEKRFRSLVFTQVPMDHWPEVTDDNAILISEDLRQSAEVVIEIAANTMAVANNCSRSIASPTPYVFIYENEDEKKWLDKTSGFNLENIAYASAKQTISIEETGITLLRDRLDGVALLAEALSHKQPMGKYHEYIRFFERAFKLTYQKIEKKLSQFLVKGDQNYTRAEVKHWFDLRDLATHADIDKHFALESEIRPYISRMEQAAYDVLMNKKVWHNSSRERRSVWKPATSIISPTIDLSITRGKEASFSFQLLDGFGSYPMDLSAILKSPPKEWWYKEITKEKILRGNAIVNQEK